MKIEIWSDIACPFCWIGKHHLELALSQLNPGDISIEWKSFELDPYASSNYKDDLFTLLANKYGQSRDWAYDMAAQMKVKGAALGLNFNFDRVIPTNTFNAHRLIHLAKTKGLQNEAEEELFRAYFEQGRHVGQNLTLTEIGLEIGLEKSHIEDMLQSDRYINEVRQDQALAAEFGIRAVPFFVINRKYGISGAQPVNHFVQVFRKVLHEVSTQLANATTSSGACSVDGCD